MRGFCQDVGFHISGFGLLSQKASDKAALASQESIGSDFEGPQQCRSIPYLVTQLSQSFLGVTQPITLILHVPCRSTHPTARAGFWSSELGISFREAAFRLQGLKLPGRAPRTITFLAGVAGEEVSDWGSPLTVESQHSSDRQQSFSAGRGAERKEMHLTAVVFFTNCQSKGSSRKRRSLLLRAVKDLVMFKGSNSVGCKSAGAFRASSRYGVCPGAASAALHSNARLFPWHR